MLRALRLAAGLVAALALLTWIASVVVHRTTRDWFENDLRLRAQLAVTGARQALAAQWMDASPYGLPEALSVLTRDERILAAGACDPAFVTLAQTADYPAALDCMSIGKAAQAAPNESSPAMTPWFTTRSLPGGNVHVSAIPMTHQSQPIGFVVLVHDVSYIERRDSKMRQYLLVAFGILAVATSLVTIVATRWSWTGWSEELRKLLRGDVDRPSQFITNIFHARYVHTDLKHQSFIEQAAEDPYMEMVYQDDQSAIFRINR